MAWESRRKLGHAAFYYVSERVGNRVVKHYIGSKRDPVASVLARAETLSQVCSKADVDAEKAAEQVDMEKAIADYFLTTATIVKIRLGGARMFRKKKRDRLQAAPSPNAEIHELTLGEFQALATRADSGNREAQQAIRELLTPAPPMPRC